MTKKINTAAGSIGAILLGAILFIAPSLANASTISSSLDLGSTGADVTSLQTFLALDNILYPSGLVTGYYGPLTAAAVARFQTRAGIVSSGTAATTGYGRVGPSTRAAINAQMGGGPVSSTWDPVPLLYNVSVAPSRNSAVITWNTNEPTLGAVYYNNAPLLETEHLNSVDVSGIKAITDTSLHTSQSVGIAGLQPNTRYYYLVYTTDSANGVTVTTPLTFQTTN